MIWPWTTISRLRREVDAAKTRIRDLEDRQQIHEIFYRTYFHEIRAAHKGIRRLVEKLKKAKQEHGTGPQG